MRGYTQVYTMILESHSLLFIFCLYWYCSNTNIMNKHTIATCSLHSLFSRSWGKLLVYLMRFYYNDKGYIWLDIRLETEARRKPNWETRREERWINIVCLESLLVGAVMNIINIARCSLDIYIVSWCVKKLFQLLH